MKRQATFTCLFIFSILMMPGCDDSEPRLISVTRMEDPDVIEYWGRVFIADADVNFGMSASIRSLATMLLRLILRASPMIP